MEPSRSIGCPERAYRTVPTPQKMQWDTNWPIPAPEVIAKAIEKPLSGCWIDHVPTGAEIAAMSLGRMRDAQNRRTSPLVTGDWASYRYVWMWGHPELMSPQMVMPDAWFDHDGARQAPPAIDRHKYVPRPGQTVRTVVGSSLAGSGYKHEALELPALWRRGLLRTAGERLLADQVLRNIDYTVLWHQIVLDEGWTVRRAAQILRETGMYVGSLCAWANRWARQPPGRATVRNAKAETAWEIHDRCTGQMTDDGRWPLSRTEEIARRNGYKRVE